MINIEKNRVYSIGDIETLHATAVETLATGSASAAIWDSQIQALEALMGSVKVMSGALISALAAVPDKLCNPDWETHRTWVDNALSSLAGRIPQRDMEGAKLLEPLSENLQYVIGMIEDLAACIESAGKNITLAEFQGRVEDIKQEWEGTLIEENIAEFETRYLGMVDNVSYSNDMYQSVKSFIPQKVGNSTTLFVYNVLERLSDISELVIAKNAIDNARLLTEDNSPLKEIDFIENQSQWGYIIFGEEGKTSMATAGCGIIATYNALHALGEDTSSQTMVELISYYEREGAALNGTLGVNPTAIEKYFIEQGYSVTATSGRGPITINMIGEQYDTVIVTAYNNENDIMDQVHTVSITKEVNETYTIHNVSKKIAGEYVSEGGFVTLYEAIENISDKEPRSIYVIGIKKTK